MSRNETKTAAAAYSTSPTDHVSTATTARADRASVSTGCSVAATTATDCDATTQMNQLPFAAASTGRGCEPSTAVHGTA